MRKKAIKKKVAGPNKLSAVLRDEILYQLEFELMPANNININLSPDEATALLNFLKKEKGNG